MSSHRNGSHQTRQYLEQNISLNGLTGRVRVSAVDASGTLNLNGVDFNCVDLIRVDAATLPVEQVLQALRDNRQVRVIVKFNARQSRDRESGGGLRLDGAGGRSLQRFLQELPEGFQISAIQSDGTWRSAGDPRTIQCDSLPPDLFVHQGDLP